MKLTNVFCLQVTPSVAFPSTPCPTAGGWLNMVCLTQPFTVIRQAGTLASPNSMKGGMSSSLIADMPPSPPHLLQKRTDRMT